MQKIKYGLIISKIKKKHAGKPMGHNDLFSKYLKIELIFVIFVDCIEK